uniref:Putative product n=1 Tax=Xenopsylla cheopis TaxID=163159 RepID=A0A6M2DYE1_XENCH
MKEKYYLVVLHFGLILMLRAISIHKTPYHGEIIGCKLYITFLKKYYLKVMNILIYYFHMMNIQCGSIYHKVHLHLPVLITKLQFVNVLCIVLMQEHVLVK